MSWNSDPHTEAELVAIMNKIRALRKARRIMTKTAATRIGMDPKYWTNLEHRRFVPTVRTVARMAHAIGYRLDVVPGTEPISVPVAPAPVETRRTSPAGPNLLRIMARIRSAREAAKLTQAQAAARASVVKATWGHLERGYVSGRDIGIERVSAAARAVGLTVDVVAEHQVPLLELEPAEVDEIRALIRWYRDRAPKMTDELVSALAKLEKQEETAP